MYGEFKDLLLRALDLRPEYLHLIMGVAIYAAGLAVTRRSVLSLWLVVFIQCANELLDAREDIRSVYGIAYRELVTDTLWTLAIPIAVTVLLKTSGAVHALVRR